MKVLVTGVSGQLGYDVVHELDKRGHISVGTDVMLPKQNDSLPKGKLLKSGEIIESSFYKADITNKKEISNLQLSLVMEIYYRLSLHRIYAKRKSIIL